MAWRAGTESLGGFLFPGNRDDGGGEVAGLVARDAREAEVEDLAADVEGDAFGPEFVEGGEAFPAGGLQGAGSLQSKAARSDSLPGFHAGTRLEMRSTAPASFVARGMQVSSMRAKRSLAEPME